jgi:hypothetical protein
MGKERIDITWIVLSNHPCVSEKTQMTLRHGKPSWHLLEKLGFKKTGERTESFRSGEDGKPVEFTGYSYELTRKEI